jgi:hypothetical protein
MSRTVGDEELERAREEVRSRGFAVLPAVGVESELSALRDRLVDLITGRTPDPGLFFQPDAPSGSYADVAFGHGYAGADVAYRKIEKLELDPLFLSWLSQPLFERLTRAVLGGGASLYRAAVFSKAAQRGSELPWHQDGGRFWGLDRDPELQAWTALDDAPPEAGCLEVVPGSHLAGLASPMGGLVPAAAVSASDAERRAVQLPARAGDVILLHNLVWHRSGPNRSDRARRALSVSYLHPDTRCTRSRRPPRQFLALWT